VPDGKSRIDRNTSGAPRRMPTITPASASIEVCAMLVIQNPAGEVVKQFAAGTRYDISIELRASTTDPNRFRLVGGVEMNLLWQGDAGVTVVDQGVIDVVKENFDAGASVTLPFQVDVAANALVGKGKLLLDYRGEKNPTSTRDLGEVCVAGKYRGATPEFGGAVKMALPAVPDPELAIVHVKAEGGELEVSAWHPLVENLEPTAIGEPDASLADVDGEQPSRKVADEVELYSRREVEALLEWLRKVIAATAGKVSIVIAEHADSRVPWEMLLLEAHGKPLGAQVVVTRWTAVSLYSQKVSLEPLRRDEHEGSVLHFVDQPGLPSSALTIAELAKCQGKPCATMNDLRAGFAAPPADLAMVYLGCHGAFATDGKHTVELQAEKNPSGVINELNLKLPKPVGERPLLVVNACHSARLVRKKKVVSGLPEFFLATYARSYFGTLGAVDEIFAGEVGAKLISQAHDAGGVNLPEFLLAMRREEADRFDGVKQARRYVSAFMYVFYGPIYSRARIR
jgi:hypothetical protein